MANIKEAQIKNIRFSILCGNIYSLHSQVRVLIVSLSRLSFSAMVSRYISATRLRFLFSLLLLLRNFVIKPIPLYYIYFVITGNKLCYHQRENLRSLNPALGEIYLIYVSILFHLFSF